MTGMAQEKLQRDKRDAGPCPCRCVCGRRITLSPSGKFFGVCNECWMDDHRPPDRATIEAGIERVIQRWHRLGLLRFGSRDDGSDDLILRDELVAAVMGLTGMV